MTQAQRISAYASEEGLGEWQSPIQDANLRIATLAAVRTIRSLPRVPLSLTQVLFALRIRHIPVAQAATPIGPQSAA